MVEIWIEKGVRISQEKKKVKSRELRKAERHTKDKHIEGEKHLGSNKSQCSISEIHMQIIYEFMVQYDKKILRKVNGLNKGIIL